MRSILYIILIITNLAFALPGQIMREIVSVVESKNSHEQLEATLDKYVDVKDIAAQVAGRIAWNAADSVERSGFVLRLKKKLLAYYADTISNLSRYRYNIIANIRSSRQLLRVVNPNGTTSDLVIFFKLKNGSWYIVDSSFNGISLIAQWRARLNNIIKEKGLTGAMHD